MAETLPTFLDLPERPGRPRSSGITHVLDKGCSVLRQRSILDAAGPYIDVWKLGWGTAYLDRNLDAKLAVLRSEGIRACTGGTLMEIAWSQGRVQELLGFAAARGFDAVEVSNGAIGMDRADKSELIERAREAGFEVFAEVGRKDQHTRASMASWVSEAEGDLSAGASWIVAEGRESGTVGLYDPDGSVRGDLVDALIAACGQDRVVFEAPRSSQQGWLIRRLGPDVNLGNIDLSEVLGVEALRLGLRADTIGVGRVERAGLDA